jgi:hypothetical protein
MDGKSMSASEATYWLREFFGESLEPIQAHRFGSHTCKTTLLTWAGRCVTVAFSPYRTEAARSSPGAQHEEHLDLLKRVIYCFVFKGVDDVQMHAQW